MARIKINSIAPITITTIEDFVIPGVLNLPMFKVVGTYVDKSGFSQQTPKNTNITFITTPYQVAWYEE